MINAYYVKCENPRIGKSATFIIYGENEDGIKKKFNRSFIHQTGMDITEIVQIQDFTMV